MRIQNLTWQQTIDIRHKVLWPNKDPSFCKVEGDETAIHYGANVKGNIVCVASLYINAEKVRLRKFATVEGFQKQGIGTAMIEHMLAESRQIPGVQVFWFDARETAIGFYKRFGFKVEGERFYKSNIADFKMSQFF